MNSTLDDYGLFRMLHDIISDAESLIWMQLLPFQPELCDRIVLIRVLFELFST